VTGRKVGLADVWGHDTNSIATEYFIFNMHFERREWRFRENITVSCHHRSSTEVGPYIAEFTFFAFLIPDTKKRRPKSEYFCCYIDPSIYVKQIAGIPFPLLHDMARDKEKSHLDVILDSPYLVLKGTGPDVEPTTLSGHVTLFLTEATSIKEVTLQFKGKAKIPVQTPDSYDFPSYRSSP